MAVDKLVDSAQLDADLASVANAIRTKGGTSANLAFPSGFVSAIGAIPSGGGGNIESGSFIATSSDSITIPVTSLHKILLIWWEDFDPDEDLSSAPYGANKVLNRIVLSPDIVSDCGYSGGFIGGAMTRYDGKALTPFGHIGGAGNNYITFTASSISITTMRVNGGNSPWLDGETYYWEAI